MGRVLLRIALALAALSSGLLITHSIDRCLGRCGNGTRCVDFHCAATSGAPAPAKPSHRRHSAISEPHAAPEVTLHPGDEKMVAAGDALGRPEHIDFSKSDDEGHERSQEELDRVFHPLEPAITKCITQAVGDAPLESGRIEVQFRVESAGKVSRVRITAPALLQRNGLAHCLRPLVTPLQFPAAGGASVVSYPFQLK